MMVSRIRMTGVCLVLLFCAQASGQSVCWPAPRLLTITPMGGQAGTRVEVTLTGQNLDNAGELSFSHPGIKAVPQTDSEGKPIPNRYIVTIAPDCPPGIHDARVMTHLGISSARAFHVSTLPEVTRQKPNTTLETAMPLEVGSICNATMTRQAVDHYTFQAKQGERIIIDCAALGIDSKLKPVLIVADAEGNDLYVERRGGAIDFTAPKEGTYIAKVHDLTFSGGSEYFYRLAVQTAAEGEDVPRLPSYETVSSFSWPPPGLSPQAAQMESEPNNKHAEAQAITLPCDISGRFFPAADVDTFEFTAKKGEVWWVEVASERLGRPTDPSIVVQRVTKEGDQEKLIDVAELTDIPSPVKISSNGYSYDGPPYNAGSSDINGKIDIPEDGTYRLQLRDLFGGTRNDPRNVYRLIVRKAAPDFSVVGWALHMNLRNGDRNALSKPIALRGGTTMPIEVVVVRRDGFDGAIDLTLENLPPGVTAAGLTIPKGKTRGILLITAAPDAPRGWSVAEFYGQAEINGQLVKRRGRIASMMWPVPDASREIPSPRLMADIPVSVSGSELAPLTIAAAEQRVWEVKAGEVLSIPLVHARRCDFSGSSISLRTFGGGFESNAVFDAPLNAESSEAKLDLGKLKTPPGEYTIAFYGSAVAKYRDRPDLIDLAKSELEQARAKAEEIASEVKRLAEVVQSATEDQKAELEQAARAAAEEQKKAAAAIKAAEKKLASATNRAKPKDIVDIVVSSPIRIRVLPAEEK